MKKRTSSKNVKKMSRQCDWEHDAMCYVLCEFIKGWDDDKKSWYIRPCDMDADKLRDLWKSNKSFNVTFGGCILHADDDESEEEFILRATIDFIDLTTGKSLDKQRKNAFKKLMLKKKRMKQHE